MFARAPAASGWGWALSKADNSPPSSQSLGPCKHLLRRERDKSLPTFTFPLNPPLTKGDLVVGCPATNDSPRGERKGMGVKRGNPTPTQIREWLFVGFVWFIGFIGFIGYLGCLECLGSLAPQLLFTICSYPPASKKYRPQEVGGATVVVCNKKRPHISGGVKPKIYFFLLGFFLFFLILRSFCCAFIFSLWRFSNSYTRCICRGLRILRNSP